jgi:hypothetical protein
VGGYQAGLKGGGQRKGRKAAMVLAGVEVKTGKRTHSTGTERDVEASGRLRMEGVRDENTVEFGAFLETNVEPSSSIRSDCLSGYVVATKNWATDTIAASKGTSGHPPSGSCE